MTIRDLTFEEVSRVWEIDRSEVVEGVYHLIDGQLELRDEYYDMKGWPPGEAEHYTPHLEECFRNDGVFKAAFESERIVGVMILETRFIGHPADQLQLVFLHVGRSQRGTGLGRKLFELAAAEARARGARRLYISATPSRNTLGFYQHLGCRVADEVDPGLFKLEPEDIHLEYELPAQ